MYQKPSLVSRGHDQSHKDQAARIRTGGSSGVDGLEDIFYEFGVDLYFAGHEHVYERFGRTYQSTTDAI